MKRKIIGILGVLMALLSLLSGSALAAMPAFSAEEGVIIKELNSGDIMAEQNANERFYPASTTKLMTALTAFDFIGSSLSEKVTVGDEVKLIGYESSVAHLEVGEVYTWEQLLYGLLLPSGNDAANVIATNIGKKISGNDKMDYNQAMAVFVEHMNSKAKQMNLEGTHFVNAHGLYDPEHYTTPADLLKIGEAAFKNATIAKIEGTKIYEMTTSKGEKQKWKNTDLLLYKDAAEYGEPIEENNPSNPYYNAKAKGGKTGFTEEAGRCFVYNAEDGDAKMIGVIMKAPEQKTLFGQANSAINAVFDDNRLLNWTEDSGHYKDFEVYHTHYKDGKTLSVKTKEAFSSMIPKASEDQYSVKVAWDTGLIEDTGDGLKVIGNMDKDQQVGSLTVYKGTEKVKSTPLYAENQVRVRNWIDYLRISLFIGVPLLIILIIILRLNTRRKKRILRQKKEQAKRRAQRKLYESQRRGSGTAPVKRTTTSRPTGQPPKKRPTGAAPRPKPSGEATPGRPTERNQTQTKRKTSPSGRPLPPKGTKKR